MMENTTRQERVIANLRLSVEVLAREPACADPSARTGSKLERVENAALKLDGGA
jgi:hypothetical protein